MKRKILFALVLMTLLVEVLKRIPAVAEFYSISVYPAIAEVLHSFSSIFSFSLYDMLIPAAIVVTGFVLWKCIKRAWKQALFILCITLVAAWLSFQVSWGINYFRPDFYTRTGLVYAQADSVKFLRFMDRYLDQLNASYPDSLTSNPPKALQTAIAGFDSISAHYHLAGLPSSTHIKHMTSSLAYAKVGVLGYYGPFFAEVHLNDSLRIQQYPFVVAHELAHLAGVTSEAEANFYAYQITRHSSDSLIRFSGYYSMLPHVLGNAQRILSEEKYKQMISRIDSGVINLHIGTRDYWNALYSPQWGALQDKIYDLYLKNNNIPTGRANYSEVIGMILASEQGDSIP